MPFRITHIASDDKLCQRLSWPLLDDVYPRERLEKLLTTYGPRGREQRVRKLTLVLVISVLICWTLFVNYSLGAVFARLSRAERWLADEEPEALPTRAAWTYRRKQIGYRLLRTLFAQSCVPLATEQTPGAYAFGLHLMAIDGTLEDVSDTVENARYFGRVCDGQSATNPQARQLHRLITTLLDPHEAPAKALCLCYHERWEAEETIDETRESPTLEPTAVAQQAAVTGLAGRLCSLARPLCSQPPACPRG